MKRRLLAAALGLLMAVGCGADERREDPGASASEWLAAVSAAHERADDAVAAAAPDRARAALAAAFEREVPAAVLGEHARAVRQDLAFRLAEIELARGAAQQALLDTERGLALGRGDDLFTANLLAARGRALADQARDTEAAASYHEALEINARLLRAALAKPGAGER